MTNLKVLFVVEFSSAEDSSAVRRILVLKDGLDKSGARTDILYLGDYILNKPRLLLPLNIPRFLRSLKEYDVVHAAGVSAFVMGIAKSFSDFKLVFDVHGSMYESCLLRKNIFDIAAHYSLFLNMLVVQVGVKKADYFITVSEPLRQNLIDRGIDEYRTEIIYNGVDAELFKPSGERVNNETFTVTYAGAFQRWQGIDNLVEAACLLENVQVKFKMIGFKKSNSALKEKIKRRLKGRVECIDYQPRERGNQPQELVDHLRRSDVLIIPRYWDPRNSKCRNIQYFRDTFGWLSTKFGEYIATSRPVIVTKLDVSADFVEKYDCGFVCDPAPESIAKAILAAKETPPEELDKKGMNGRHLAETEFDLRVTGKKYFDFLSRIV